MVHLSNMDHLVSTTVNYEIKQKRNSINLDRQYYFYQLDIQLVPTFH